MPRPEAFVKENTRSDLASIRVYSLGEDMAASGWSKKLADLMSSAQQETESSGVGL